jgi:hypothetical protein
VWTALRFGVRWLLSSTGYTAGTSGLDKERCGVDCMLSCFLFFFLFGLGSVGYLHIGSLSVWVFG